MQAADF